MGKTLKPLIIGIIIGVVGLYAYQNTEIRSQISDFVGEVLNSASEAPAPSPTPLAMVALPEPSATPTQVASTQVTPISTATPSPSLTATPEPEQLPTGTPTLTPMPTPVRASYSIEVVSMKALENGQVDFMLEVKNDQVLEDEIAQIEMSVDDGAPELVNIIANLPPGESTSFAFTRSFDPGSHAIEFSVGDSHTTVNVNIESEEVAVLTPTPQPTVTATPTIIPTPMPTNTPIPANTPMPTITPLPINTPTLILTPETAVFPTPIPGRSDLYEYITPPEHMANIWWEWEEGKNKFRELVIDFTIHNDPGLPSDRNGLYLMLCYSEISDIGFYFGLQTDSWRGERGKRIIYSRWGTRDLASTRVSDPTEGWTESSGHEGDFIGVRRSYNWTAGDYRARMAPDGAPDTDGEWYGVWITELSSGVTTWAGSLKFPLVDGETVIKAPTFTTLEIYGGAVIRPIDIPEWHVSLKMPLGDGERPSAGYIDYSPFTEGAIMNSEVSVVSEDGSVYFHVGGTTERKTPEGWSTW